MADGSHSWFFSQVEEKDSQSDEHERPKAHAARTAGHHRDPQGTYLHAISPPLFPPEITNCWKWIIKLSCDDPIRTAAILKSNVMTNCKADYRNGHHTQKSAQGAPLDPTH